MAYETRLQGVSGDKISGGVAPLADIFGPLPVLTTFIRVVSN